MGLLSTFAAVFVKQKPTGFHDLDSRADVVWIITGVMAPCAAMDNGVCTPECCCLKVAHGSGVDTKQG